MAAAMRELGAPFSVLELADDNARAVYGCDLLLLRPDMHVAWRGNAPPADPRLVARIVTGHAAGSDRQTGRPQPPNDSAIGDMADRDKTRELKGNLGVRAMARTIACLTHSRRALYRN